MSGKRKTDEIFINALACGASLESAARKANLSERTAYRRLADPAVKQRIAEVRADTAQRLGGMATVAGLEGIKTLVTLQDPAYPPQVRLRAAEASVELGLKLREENELLRRFDGLEQAVRARLDVPSGDKTHEPPLVVPEVAPPGEPVGQADEEGGEPDLDVLAS